MKRVILELEDEQVEFLDRCGDRSAAARKLLARAIWETDYEKRLRKIMREELARCSRCAEINSCAEAVGERQNAGRYTEAAGERRSEGRYAEAVWERQNAGRQRESAALGPGSKISKDDLTGKFDSELKRLFNL